MAKSLLLSPEGDGVQRISMPRTAQITQMASPLEQPLVINSMVFPTKFPSWRMESNMGSNSWQAFCGKQPGIFFALILLIWRLDSLPRMGRRSGPHIPGNEIGKPVHIGGIFIQIVIHVLCALQDRDHAAVSKDFPRRVWHPGC